MIAQSIQQRQLQAPFLQSCAVVDVLGPIGESEALTQVGVATRGALDRSAG